MSQQSLRNELISELKLELGDQMVDVELDTEHYELAIKQAIEVLRQQSDGGIEESILFVTMQPDTQSYQLPAEVLEVQKIYRRGLGHSGSTVTFDPYEANFYNQYVLNNQRGGGLATWDFAHQHLEVLGRLLGVDIAFNFNSVSKKITVQRNFSAAEEVLLQVYNIRPEISLLSDVYIKPWIRKYAHAKCKVMLGEAREKFSTIAGPNGGTTLNGAQLKAEGLAQIEQAIDELRYMQVGSAGLPMVIG